LKKNSFRKCKRSLRRHNGVWRIVPNMVGEHGFFSQERPKKNNETW